MQHIKKYKTSILFFFILNSQITYSQELILKTSGTKTSLRGLSVVDNSIIWASGSNGMVARSIDGGNNFTWMQVPHFEKREFRDIEAFDINTAIIISIAEPAQILKTIDGGNNWRIVFTDSTKGMFLDAMDFIDEKNGVVIGDPINNKSFLAFTHDAGETWTTQSDFEAPHMQEGEAFFASSGTNIKMQKTKNTFNYFFASGGKHSNFYQNNSKLNLPLTQGIQSTGANSIALYKTNAIIVGGDFTKDSIKEGNCTLLNLKTLTLTSPVTNPSGYRSCVIFFK